jgi:hypothetical protein
MSVLVDFISFHMGLKETIDGTQTTRNVERKAMREDNMAMAISLD